MVGQHTVPVSGALRPAPHVRRHAALVDAVRNAPAVPGTTTIDIPATPETIWRATRDVRAQSPGTAACMTCIGYAADGAQFRRESGRIIPASLSGGGIDTADTDSFRRKLKQNRLRLTESSPD